MQPTMTMDYRVFLSYTTADSDLANSVRRAARVLDIDVYMYEEDPQAGNNLGEKLIRQIDQSDALVALLTTAGNQRPAIAMEVGCALKARKPVIAVVEQGVDIAPYTLLQGREYVRLERADPTSALLEIQEALRRHRSTQASDLFLLGAIIVLAFVALGGRGES